MKNPGIIPKNNFIKVNLKHIFLVSYLFIFIFKKELKNEINKEKKDIDFEIINFDEPKVYFNKGRAFKAKICPTCKIFRPPGVSHCSICNVCIERYDHHCPWLGNCIGRSNYLNFLGFLTCIEVLLVLVSIICSVIILKKRFKNCENDITTDIAKELEDNNVYCNIKIVFPYTLLSLSVFKLFFLSLLYFHHLNFTTKNITTYIYSKMMDIVILYGNPFDKGGAIKNIKNLFKTYICKSNVEFSFIIQKSYFLENDNVKYQIKESNNVIFRNELCNKLNNTDISNEKVKNQKENSKSKNFLINEINSQDVSKEYFYFKPNLKFDSKKIKNLIKLNYDNSIENRDEMKSSNNLKSFDEKKKQFYSDIKNSKNFNLEKINEYKVSAKMQYLIKQSQKDNLCCQIEEVSEQINCKEKNNNENYFNKETGKSYLSNLNSHNYLNIENHSVRKESSKKTFNVFKSLNGKTNEYSDKC